MDSLCLLCRAVIPIMATEAKVKGDALWIHLNPVEQCLRLERILPIPP